MKKASEDRFNHLHNILTEELISRIESGEASAQEMKAAIEWLSKNDISGVAMEGSSLDKLAKLMPKVDPELVQSRLYGRKHS